MREMEVEVISSRSECKLINLAIPLSQLDSLRLTAYLFLRLFKSEFSEKMKEVIKRIEENRTYLMVSSPFFLVRENGIENTHQYYLPVNFGFFSYYEENFKDESGEFPTKEIKKIRYFPVLDKKSYNPSFVKTLISKGLEFEIGPLFRVKNLINRNTYESENVYTIENYFVFPFRFIVETNDVELEDMMKKVLFNQNESVHFLGKRISIGFGKVKFRHDYRFKSELEKRGIRIERRVEKGVPYYLFNRIPITEKMSNLIDTEKSSYELVKISGYFVEDEALIGRNMICLKEGSILVFKDSVELENEIYKIKRSEHKKEYFLPYTPFLIKMEV